MRRWNGWGETDEDFPLPAEAVSHLEHALGPGSMILDCPLASALESVPAARHPPTAGVSTDPEIRLRHARGQSLPDWIALRSGQIKAYPDGVAFPQSEDDVVRLLEFADRQDLRLIPYGGGTSVVGHINPLPGARPVVTVNLQRMDRLLDLDPVSRLATFQAGVTGPSLERALAPRGMTLGHFPQSFEYSTLGGWVVTRSTGQQSLGYGRIEDLFAGGRLETPAGRIDLSPHPASAAGPDLRHLVLGSEGRLGFLTRATVRIRPRPERERFGARFYRSWEEGLAAVRNEIQAGTRASMLRLSDPSETHTTLLLAGKPSATRWLSGALRLTGSGADPCLLVSASDARPGGESGAFLVGRSIGNQWRKSRFRAPYLRNSLWEAGYATDTLETAFAWNRLEAGARAVLETLRSGLDDEAERVLAFAHLSHAYLDGASLYATYLFRRHPDPEHTLARWRRLKTAASQALLAHGGTISHQHGVGLDHLAFVEREKGEVGIRALKAAVHACDPRGLMNPGKLLV